MTNLCVHLDRLPIIGQLSCYAQFTHPFKNHMIHRSKLRFAVNLIQTSNTVLCLMFYLILRVVGAEIRPIKLSRLLIFDRQFELPNAFSTFSKVCVVDFLLSVFQSSNTGEKKVDCFFSWSTVPALGKAVFQRNPWWM